MILWLWIGLLAAIAITTSLDLIAVHRRAASPSAREALLSTLVWTVGAALFGVLIFFVYHEAWLDRSAASALTPQPAGIAALDGHTALLQFLAAYAVETALSLDNIAVLSLVFACYRVPPSLISRVLAGGFAASVAARLALVLMGAWLLRTSPWAAHVLGAFLVMLMFRTLLMPQSGAALERRPLVRLLTRIIPNDKQPHGTRLLARLAGRTVATPFLMALIIAGTSDMTYAADSIPAVLAVTRDPFLAFAGSSLALLGVRPLYFAASGLVTRFRYLRLCVVLILLAVAAKMFLINYSNTATIITLATVAGILPVATLASVLHARWPGAAVEPPPPEPAPIPAPIEDLAEAVLATRRNLRKVFVLIAGTIVLCSALVIGPLPGPGGVFVVAAGLAILATEFVWARRLLNTFKAQSAALGRRTDQLAENTSVWIVPAVIILYVAVTYAAIRFRVLPEPLLVAGSLGGVFPLALWTRRTIAAVLRQRRRKADSGPDQKPEALKPTA